MNKACILFLLSAMPWVVNAQVWVEDSVRMEKFIKSGNYTDALPVADNVLEKMRKQAGAQSVIYAEMMMKAARLHVEMPSVDKVEGFLLKAEEILRKDSSLMYARCLNYLGNFYRATGKHPMAVSSLEKALVVKEKYGLNDTVYASYASDLGLAYQNVGKYTESMKILEKAIAIYETLDKTTGLYYANCIDNLAMTYGYLDNYVKSEQLQLKSIRIKKNILGEENVEYAQAIENLATLYHQLTRYDESIDLHQQSLSIYERQKNSGKNEYWETKQNYFATLSKAGRFAEAEKVGIQLDNFFENTPSINKYNYATFLNNRAMSLFFQTGRYKEAELGCLKSLQVYEQSVGTKHPYYINTLINLSNVYRNTGSYAKTDSLLTLVVETRRIAFGYEDLSYGHALTSMGSFKMLQKKVNEAIDLFQQSADVFEKKMGKKNLLYVDAYGALANAYFFANAYDKTYQMYNELNLIYDELVGKSNYRRLRVYSDLAEISTLAGDEKVALQNFNDYSRLLQKYVEDIFGVLNEYEKGKILDAQSTHLNNFFDLVARRNITDHYGQVLNLRLFMKAILLYSSKRTKNYVERQNNESLKKLYQQLSLERNNIAKSYNLTITQQKKQNLDLSASVARADSLEKQLITFIGDTYTADPRSDWKDVQKALKPEQAALEIIRIKQFNQFKLVRDTISIDTVYYAVLIIKPDTEYPELVLLQDGKDLEGRYLQAYRNDIRNKTYEADAYNWFWQPIANRLQGVKTVYIAADGVYHQINLQTLLNTRTGKYAGQERNIRLLNSTRELAQKATRPAGNEFALFGFPDYEQKSVTELGVASASTERGYYPPDLERGGEYTPLPGTKVEIEAIEKIVSSRKQKARLYSGSAASEEAIKALNGPKVLHIATHGYFESNLTGQPGRNPMLRSGLLLAGARRTLEKKDSLAPSGEDGVLTAYEATGLNLEGTEQVVLSACETGLGEVKNGEGVYGLQRAFAIAGARSVLMSLWKVNDQVTGQLMEHFYRYWLGGKDKHTALQKAQQKIRRQYPHPSFWGGFVLVGK